MSRTLMFLKNAAKLTHKYRTRPNHLFSPSQHFQMCFSSALVLRALITTSPKHLRAIIFLSFVRPKMTMTSLMHRIESRLFCSDGSVSQSQDDSIVGTRQCRHSLAIMPIPGTLSSSSPDLLQPTTSIMDFSNPSGKTGAALA